MIEKACNRCGGGIVFGHEYQTGKVLPLSVGLNVYRVVQENVVTLDTNALVPHVCITPKDGPRPDRELTEQK